jgi:nitrile hydratase beta subunit
MNGVHDLGGVDGYGAVEVEAGEPVFHAEWERRVFGLISAMSTRRLANVHYFCHTIERMEPLHYLASPYYEHWLTAMATIAVEKGAVGHDELMARAGGSFPLSRPERKVRPASAPASATAPRFGLGEEVVVRNQHPLGHTRCPRYVRGKRGIVVRIDDPHPLPDIAAHQAGAPRQFQYCVRFAAGELWGKGAGANECMHVDLWEAHLEKA